MPVIKSAKKKLRKDKKITAINNKLKALLKSTIKQAEKKPTEASVQKAVKMVDKVTKKNILHKNKASKIKSRLAKKLPKKNTVTKAPSKKSTAKK